MKHLSVIIIVIFAVIICQTSALAADSLKIGVLISQKCWQESNMGKQLAEKLKNKGDSMQAEFDKKQQELVDMQQEIEKQSLMLSMDAKENRQKEFEKKRRDLAYLAQDLQEELKNAENDARREFQIILRGVLDTLAKKKELDFIVDSTVVFYFTEKLDITDEIIAEMNKVKP